MKKFKKIYIEITNKCNLKCSFCPQDNLQKREMSLLEFEIILQKIDIYTDYVYLHVKGEPLLHSNIKDIICLCKKYNKNVNITTNGTLLKNKYKDLLGIRELNISLQSVVNITIIDDIFDICDILSESIFISYRLWVKNKYESIILDKIKTRYNSLDNKLSKNIYLNFGEKFIWPDLNNDVINKTGKCYGTKDHIGILVDGTIVPCCLDSKGIINLGNIFKDDLEYVLNNERFIQMQNGFNNNIRCEELCQKCGYNIKKEI